jgi:hypothetical protein
VGLSQLSDNSFFCHLRTGQWMLEHGVPHHDIYSFVAAGAPWVCESWLAELLYGVTDRFLGAGGLRLLTALTCAGIAALAYRLAVRLARDRVLAALLTLAATGASFTIWSARPLLLGLLAFQILVWIIEVDQSLPGRWPLLSIPPVIWLWANIHGSFPLGFVYIAFHCLGRWLDGIAPWRSRERQLVGAALIALGLCLLNPYGTGLLLAPFHLLHHHDVLRNVVEWQPPDFRHLDLRAIMYAVWLLTFASCAAVGIARFPRRDIVVSLPFLLVGFWAQRNIALAPLVTLPIAARAIATAVPRAESRLTINWVLAAAVAMLAILWTVQAAARPNFDFQVYPVAAMQTLEAKGLLGRRLLSTDPWNDYVILRWWPRQYIFMDDRYDLYPAPVAEALIALRRDQADWRHVLARYGIEVVVWPPQARMVAGLRHEPGWVSVYCDSTAAVFAKRTLVDHQLIAHRGSTAGFNTVGPHRPGRCGTY